MPSPGWFSRMSIARKLPLVAGALILAVAALVSVAAILEVRHIALAAARQHISDIVKAVDRNDGRPTGAATFDRLDSIAANPALLAYLRRPDDAHRPAALGALLMPGRNRALGLEIVDDSGRTVLSTRPGLEEAANEFPIVVHSGTPGSVGRIRPVQDSIVAPFAVRIPAMPGYRLVEWVHVTASPEALHRTQQLIGAGTTLLIGNRDGSYWMDMLRLTPSPSPVIADTGVVKTYTRVASTGPVISMGATLRGVPWGFAVEIPRRTVLAPTEPFIRIIIALAILAVILGVLAAWWFARRLTSPLAQLTDAAQALAGGEEAVPPPIARTDELGRLNESFTVMAREVRDARTRLEHEAAERTRELRSALDQLAAAQEAFARREKLAVLGQLAGGVGHELRNPLGVISNAIYYLEAVQPEAPENVRNYLHLMRQQVELSTKIIGDLLDFSRVSPAQRRAVELTGIVREQLARVPLPAQVAIAVHIPDDLPPVDVDPVQIGQIVYNLVTNAVQALNGTGRITLRAEATADGVALQVSDTGPGIPPELMDRIFEPLFTTKARGIGLGLAVSRSLARANGGDVFATNTASGATFTIAMPVAAEVTA